LIFLDSANNQATKLKAEILREYAGEQINCPARHYYLRYSKEMQSEI